MNLITGHPAEGLVRGAPQALKLDLIWLKLFLTASVSHLVKCDCFELMFNTQKS